MKDSEPFLRPVDDASSRGVTRTVAWLRADGAERSTQVKLEPGASTVVSSYTAENGTKRSVVVELDPDETTWRIWDRRGSSRMAVDMIDVRAMNGPAEAVAIAGDYAFQMQRFVKGDRAEHPHPVLLHGALDDRAAA